jgi:hypothetical protein
VMERLQKMGSIPHEARRLAGELRKAGFSIAPSLRHEVRTRILEPGGAGR